MTIQELNALLANPAKVDAGHFADIRLLLQEYPFVSSFRLLLQKGLCNTHDVISDTELHRTALFAPCRNQLMLLLMQQPVVEVAEEKIEPAKTVSSVVEVKAANTNLNDRVEPEVESDGDFSAAASLRFGTEVDAFLLHFEAEKAKRKEQEKEADETPLRVRPNLRSDDDFVADEQLAQNEHTTKSGGFFTETLAKIYIKQEKFQKAIGIFEELRNKVPEKSEYYGEQIRFLEKLIKYS